MMDKLIYVALKAIVDHQIATTPNPGYMNADPPASYYELLRVQNELAEKLAHFDEIT